MTRKVFDVADGVVIVTKGSDDDSGQPVIVAQHTQRSGVSFSFTYWFHADVAGYKDRDLDFDSCTMLDAEMFAAMARGEAAMAVTTRNGVPSIDKQARFMDIFI